MLGRWAAEMSRPLALAFRQLTVMAGGYSYVWHTARSGGLLSLSLFLAGAAALPDGTACGLGSDLAGLIYILVRPFLVTTLTEPLGLILVLLSVTFLLDAIQLRSLPNALLAVAGITAALFVRMGDMFLAPVLVLWVGFATAGKSARRLRNAGAAAAIVLAVVVLNILIAMICDVSRKYHWR